MFDRHVDSISLSLVLSDLLNTASISDFSISSGWFFNKMEKNDFVFVLPYYYFKPILKLQIMFFFILSKGQELSETDKRKLLERSERSILREMSTLPTKGLDRGQCCWNSLQNTASRGLASPEKQSCSCCLLHLDLKLSSIGLPQPPHFFICLWLLLCYTEWCM